MKFSNRVDLEVNTFEYKSEKRRPWFLWTDFFQHGRLQLLRRDAMNDPYKNYSTTFYQACKMQRGPTPMYNRFVSHFFNRKSSSFLTMGIHVSSLYISIENAVYFHGLCTPVSLSLRYKSEYLHADGLPWKFKFSLS